MFRGHSTCTARRSGQRSSGDGRHVPTPGRKSLVSPLFVTQESTRQRADVVPELPIMPTDDFFYASPKTMSTRVTTTTTRSDFTPLNAHVIHRRTVACNAMNAPAAVRNRNRSSVRRRSDASHVSVSSCQRRHACGSVSRSPGISRYSPRMRSTSASGSTGIWRVGVPHDQYPLRAMRTVRSVTLNVRYSCSYRCSTWSRMTR